MNETAAVPRRIADLGAAARGPHDFSVRSTWARRQAETGISDFTFGNPHEMPLPGFVEALRQWSTPLNKDWFAYVMSDPEGQRVIAAALERWCGLAFEPDDIALTNGGMAALMVGMKAVTDPGDEVIYSLPAWFNYEPMILDAGLRPVTVDLTRGAFDLDLDAIEGAITERTRIVVVNTPHNPTGRVYSPGQLRELAQILQQASARHGRPVYILSDEPYRNLVFEGRRSYSPAEFYPHTLIAYSYGKVLLTPGQRVGYLAIPPTMPDREVLRESIRIVQIACGWAFPNALLQHALADLEQLSISVERLQRKRDRMAGALQAIGYETRPPEGTFYLFVRSPWEDDAAFTELLASHNVFVMPGRLFGISGYFRISLTASEEMIERGLPGFAAAWEQARNGQTSAVMDAAGGRMTAG